MPRRRAKAAAAGDRREINRPSKSGAQVFVRRQHNGSLRAECFPRAGINFSVERERELVDRNGDLLCAPGIAGNARNPAHFMRADKARSSGASKRYTHSSRYTVVANRKSSPPSRSIRLTFRLATRANCAESGHSSSCFSIRADVYKISHRRAESSGSFVTRRPTMFPRARFSSSRTRQRPVALKCDANA